MPESMMQGAGNGWGDWDLFIKKMPWIKDEVVF
jgi:hypothetical protein